MAQGTRFMFWLGICAILAGCKHPFTVRTNGNINTKGQITTRLPPKPGIGAVQAQQVGTSSLESTGCKIAIIEVDGVLLNMNMVGMSSFGENPVELFRERLQAVAKDPCVKAVVLRVNSPGGGVTACDIMRQDLANFRERTGIPVVACLMDVGTSGAYYAILPSDRIVAHPTSITGGMGVIFNRYSLTTAMEQFNVFYKPIKAGKNIDTGTCADLATTDNSSEDGESADTKSADDQAEDGGSKDDGRADTAILQPMANEYHVRLREAVLSARPEAAEHADVIFDGRIFTATQGVELDLIDDVGYIDDAVNLASELAGISGAKLVMYHRCNDIARTLYASTPNVPLHSQMLPFSVPGLERSKLPTFLYLWQPDPTLERWGGR